jgi:hypothetical protein
LTIRFKENGFYNIDSQLIFEPPRFNKKTLHHIYNANNALLEKLRKNIPLIPSEEKDLFNMPSTYLICYLNDFSEAKEHLYEAKDLLNQNRRIYRALKESLRILRKVKYN